MAALPEAQPADEPDGVAGKSMLFRPDGDPGDLFDDGEFLFTTHPAPGTRAVSC